MQIFSIKHHKVKPSISIQSKPCTMTCTRLLKCFVLNTPCSKTKHLRSLVRWLVRGFDWLEILGLRLIENHTLQKRWFSWFCWVINIEWPPNRLKQNFNGLPHGSTNCPFFRGSFWFDFEKNWITPPIFKYIHTYYHSIPWGSKKRGVISCGLVTFPLTFLPLWPIAIIMNSNYVWSIIFHTHTYLRISRDIFLKFNQ